MKLLRKGPWEALEDLDRFRHYCYSRFRGPGTSDKMTHSNRTDYTMTRHDGRKPDELRPWTITRGVLSQAEGSAFIEAGCTKVLCAASVEERVPPFLRDQGSGWITSEYSMLPRSTHSRRSRERGSVGGRTMEIQRLIGRSLRCVTDLRKLPELTITLDCDVIQADGGTRTASITAAWVALSQALDTLKDQGRIPEDTMMDSVAAVSVGIVSRETLLDLDYVEDSAAEVDMNVVMTGKGLLVEVQATAEGAPFSISRMNRLVSLARTGLQRIEVIQRESRAGDLSLG